MRPKKANGSHLWENADYRSSTGGQRESKCGRSQIAKMSGHSKVHETLLNTVNTINHKTGKATLKVFKINTDDGKA